MSASKFKRERQNLYQADPLKKEPEKVRQERKKKKLRRILIICAAVLLIAAVAAVLLSSGIFITHSTAATVGGHKLSPALFGCFYHDAYYKFYNENSGFISQILDTSKPLDEQVYSKEDGTTWADYFVQEAAKSAAETYAIYNEAVAAKYQLTAEDEKYLSDLKDDVHTYANYMKYKSDAEFLSKNYGKGCTMDVYMEYSRISRMATSYAAAKKASYSYTEKQMDDAYNADPNSYNSVSYKIYYVSETTGKYDKDGKAIADMQKSEAEAKKMAEDSCGNIDEFNRQALELAPEKKKAIYSDPDYTLRSNYMISRASEPLRGWLTEAGRKYGDTTYVQADARAYYVCFYLGCSDNNYPLVNMRQIFVQPVADSTNKDDPQGTKKVKTDAQAILDTFESGAKTEDAFAALAKEKSDDTSTSENGGLYTNYYPGQLNEAVTTWCFDKSRKQGDCTSVEGSDGVHILYYVGQGINYRRYLEDKNLRDADYKKWHDGVCTLKTRTHWFGLLYMSR